MGEASGMYGGEDRCTQGFGGKIWGKETYLEELGGEVDIRGYY